MENKYLLYGGILAPLIFLLNDLIGGLTTPNYSFIENTISDLTKTGTQDTYLLGSVLLFISAVFAILFGIGIISKFKFMQNKLVFLGGVLLIFMGLSNTLSGTIFPQDHIGGEVTFPGTMHLILVAISAILIFPTLLMIGFGLNKKFGWKKFRCYSILTLIAMVVFGGLTAYVAMNNIAALGLVERVIVYLFQAWSIVLAYLLLKEK